MYSGTVPANLSSMKVLEIANPPELPQAKVNKCLIALVNRKIVAKESHGVCREASSQ